MPEVLRVCVTGAAGQIAYSLLPLIANGRMFGKDQKVALNLLDIPPAMKMLGGVVMELEDGAYPLLADVVATDDLKTAFTGIHLAILVGAMPRREGMERKDLLKANAKIFKDQGEALNQFADPEVRVLVVGNPANTNCGIAMACAPKIPRTHFTALTRLDQNRANAMLARHLNTPVGSVGGVAIWGNHSSTQYPDVTLAVADGKAVEISDREWLTGTFEPSVQKRGAAVIGARGLSSAMSAANAITDHVRDWYSGSTETVNNRDIVSMAVCSDGSYGVAEGLIYSFPLRCKGNWEYEIVKDVEISDHSREMMKATEKELAEEKETAHAFLG